MRRVTAPVLRLTGLGALLATLLLALTAAGAAAAPGATAARSCDIGGKERRLGASYVTSLSARGTSCRRAQRVVRAYHACRRRHGGADGRCPNRVRRYRCRERRTSVIETQYDARVTCRRGGKRIRHAYTQFT